MGYLVDPERWNHSSEYQDSVYHRFGHGIEEEEANLFAAAFLMPAEQFHKAVADLGNAGAFPVKQLALQFRTSASAVLRRGEELGILRLSTNGHR
jgi:Zn-dependent peptidase ImmA (M78 family)